MTRPPLPPDGLEMELARRSHPHIRGPSRLERYEQADFVRALKAAGFVALHIRNEGKEMRDVRFVARQQREGLLEGAPDILILDPIPLRPERVAIEMKRTDATPCHVSDNQRLRIADLRQRGWIAEWCRGCCEAIRLCEHIWGERRMAPAWLALAVPTRKPARLAVL